jgi:hypothetical protein
MSISIDNVCGVFVTANQSKVCKIEIPDAKIPHPGPSPDTTHKKMAGFD